MSRPSPALRLWVPVVASAVVQLPAAAWAVRLEQADAASAALTLGMAALGPLALIAARRAPGIVVVLCGAAALVLFLVGIGGGPPPIAFAFALVGAVVRGARVWAWAVLAVAWSSALVLAVVLPSEPWHPPRIAATTLGLLFVTALGEAARGRRERLRMHRETLERRRRSAAEEERLRIARELHDVLAHSLSQINVQAGVGLHLAEAQPERAAEALASIKAASKSALDEVRAVLGILRSEGEDAPRAPHPGTAELGALVAGTRLPGVAVEYVDELAGAEVPAPVGAAAYRIVQEALTNVARHGQGVTRVRVRVGVADGHLHLEVRDDGRPAPAEPGRGLLGMRERTELLDGSFHTAFDDGFVVRAEIPMTEAP